MRTFSVKFPKDQAVMIEMLAADSGQTISEFIRERVLSKEDIRDELMALQRMVVALAGEARRAHPEHPDQVADNALLLETVLRLRALSNPTTTAAIFAEMKRQGMTPYAPQ